MYESIFMLIFHDSKHYVKHVLIVVFVLVSLYSLATSVPIFNGLNFLY